MSQERDLYCFFKCLKYCFSTPDDPATVKMTVQFNEHQDAISADVLVSKTEDVEKKIEQFNNMMMTFAPHFPIGVDVES